MREVSNRNETIQPCDVDAKNYTGVLNPATNRPYTKAEFYTFWTWMAQQKNQPIGE